MIIQAIGFIGVLCFIISFQFRSTKALLICQITGSSIFCLQFILLGAYIGAINLIVGIFRNFLVVNRDRLPWARSWLVCFGLIGIFGLIFAYWLLGNPYGAVIPVLTLILVWILKQIWNRYRGKTKEQEKREKKRKERRKRKK